MARRELTAEQVELLEIIRDAETLQELREFVATLGYDDRAALKPDIREQEDRINEMRA